MNNWDDYRLILALHRAKTIRRAAKKLGVNHSTISRRLAILNGNKHGPIFEKVTGGYQANNIGQTLVDAAKQIEEINYKSIRQERANTHDISGSITVSVSPPLGRYILLDEFARFSAMYPDIDLKILASYQLVNLDKSEADIVVRGTDHPPDHLVGRRPFPYALSYYCHKDYLENTAEEDRCWIGKPEDTDAPDWIARSPFPNAKIGLKIGDINLRHDAAINGYGFTRGACFMADQAPELIRLPNAVPMPFQTFWVLTHPDLKDTPRIKILMRFISDALNTNRSLLEGILPPLK
jgi:DNA-binding transcriptional LysR family regulator